MSDLERARNFLAEQDYEFIWRSPDGYETVWRKGDVDVGLDQIGGNATITVPLSELPSLLSGLKLEDVEKAICHVIAYEGVPPRVPVERFVGLITERLRQQVKEVSTEIERLREQVREYREALRPFAAFEYADRWPDDELLFYHNGAEVTIGDVRRAKAVLEKG